MLTGLARPGPPCVRVLSGGAPVSSWIFFFSFLNMAPSDLGQGSRLKHTRVQLDKQTAVEVKRNLLEKQAKNIYMLGK